MAQSSSSAQPQKPGQRQPLHAPGFPAAFQPVQGSVPMEQSISSSSISSSISSFPSSSFSSASTSTPFLPTTPQRHLKGFFPAPSMAAFDGHVPSKGAAPTGIKKALDISNLMSPPEPDQMDSFSINNSASPHSRCSSPGVDSNRNVSKAGNVPKNGPLSPPISPRDRKTSAVATDLHSTAAQAARDPILYPTGNDASSLAQSRPLFAAHGTNTTTHSNSTIGVVSDHVAARSPTLFSRASPPRGEDYELALYLKSEVMKRYMVDRRGWLKKEREQLLADRKAAADRNRRLHLVTPATRPPPTVPHLAVSRPVKPQHSSSLPEQPRQPMHTSELRQHQTNQSNHQRSSPLQPVLDNNARVSKRTGRAAPLSRSTLPTRIAPQVSPARQATGGNTRTARGSPEPRVRTAAPNREDKDFMSLPDCCPPLSTLPERTNNLKVDWKGNALDLTRDPYLHLLHRDEVGLAASLRLDCATYLTSKRRIFIRRLECARIGKEFRKTDAQQACKIDVNKASKLWTAYDKVGWLRLEHMQRFI